MDTDWELLHNSDPDSTLAAVSDDHNPFDQSSIHHDYFSSDPYLNHHRAAEDDVESAQSDNPSWIDPASEDNNSTRFLNKDSGEFWSDSTSDRSENLKFTDLEDGKDVNFLNFQGIGGMIDDKAVPTEAENSDVGVRGIENSNLNNESEAQSEVLAQQEIENDSGNVEKRGLVWWKMPMELLKYCLFKMNPVWTVSMAATVMGFMILGRRLYTMKKKAKGLQIKVTIDDKKVSQVMSRAARLNEAFSVVKRVPVIRPSLPAVGVSTWPVMSLR